MTLRKHKTDELLLKNAMLEHMKDKLKVGLMEVLNSAGTRKAVKRKTGYGLHPVMEKVPHQSGVSIHSMMEVDEEKHQADEGEQSEVPQK